MKRLVSSGVIGALVLLSAVAASAETIELKAKPTVTPVELNRGDSVVFTLLNGERRTIKAVDMSANLVEIPVVEGLVFRFDATLEVDGHRVTIDRYTATQQAFYEPIVIDGVRIWVDMVLAVFDVVPMRYPGEGNLRQRPWKDIRLALQDATIEDCPVKLSKWFDYKHPSISIGDCYHGGDCWMGAFGEGVTHGGLDINQRKGDPLYAPMDFDGQGYFQSVAKGDNNNRWRGWRTWPDGSVWAFQIHHVITQRVDQGVSVKQGTHLFDGAGVWIGWYEHNHYEFKVANGKVPDWDAGGRNKVIGDGRRALEKGQPEVYHLDPWIYFRQIFRNEREKTGYVYPEMAPLGPAKTGEAVSFELRRTDTPVRSSETFWDFGDGTFARGEKVTHRYAKPGLYAARAVIVRADGTRDEVIRHLTVNGAATQSPALVVETDDFRFIPWKAGAQYPFAYDLVNYRPGVFEIIVAGALRPQEQPVESRTIRYANAGGGALPKVAAEMAAPCEWLRLKPFDGGVTFDIETAKVPAGTNEAAIVLKGEGFLNGDVTVPVRVVKNRVGPINGDFMMDNNANRGFYATPGFWCSQRLCGSRRQYKSSGFRPDADAIARFTPEPLSAGTYRVRVVADTPWAIGSACWVNVRDADGLHRVRFEPAKSWTVGTFRFAAGCGNYVEFQTKDSLGSVVVNHLAFDRVKDKDVGRASPPCQPGRGRPGHEEQSGALPGRGRPGHGETVELKAKPTVTPVELDCGDMVRFTLLNGETRTLKLVDTSARIAACTAVGTVHAFDMTLEIDGHALTLERNTGEPEAFYEPFVVNGVRIWPDAVRKLFDVVPLHEPCPANRRQKPSKDARIALQDATIEDCPVKLTPWLDMKRLAPSVNDWRIGGMCWMGSFFGRELHAGLDIRQQPETKMLSAPIDFDDQTPLPELWRHSRDGRWRGTHAWPDGSVWAFDCVHIVTQSVPAHVSVKQGTTFLTGGKPQPAHHMHTHFGFRIANGPTADWESDDVYCLDPWIYFRQIFRNEREKTGYVYPEMAPLGPAKTGEAVAFELRRTDTPVRSSETYWDFGDGAFARGEKVTHRYAKPGLYAARAVIVRADGTKDEVIRYLTVDGAPLAAPSLAVSADVPAFFPRPVGAPQAFAYGRAVRRPGTLAFKTSAKSPHVETCDLSFANIGGGALSKLTVSVKAPCAWLAVEQTQDGARMTVDGAKAPAGTNEAVVVVSGEGLLNGAVEVPVTMTVGGASWNERDMFDMFIKGDYCYVTPGGWLETHPAVYSSCGRNRAGDVARFEVDMLGGGTYEVRVTLDSPVTPGLACDVRVRCAEGVRTVRFEPAKSMSLGTFRFARGNDSYIEFPSAGATGEVVVNRLKLFRRNGERSARELAVASPDGRNTIVLKTAPLRYAVLRDGRTVVSETPIGLTVDGRDLGRTETSFATEGPLAKTGSVATPVYKKASVDLSCNEAFADFGDWGLRLVARTDGVAYRFETKFPRRVTVDGERADLIVPSREAHALMNFTRHVGCEETYAESGPIGELKTWENGREMIYLPLVYTIGGTTVAVTESDVRDYPVWNLVVDEKVREGAGFTATFARAPKRVERDGRWIRVAERAAHLAKTSGARTFPWRTFVLADAPSKLCEADIVYALAPAAAGDFSWVSPGLVAWDWWNCFDNQGDKGCNTKTYERFIDFAAKNGVAYVIFDEGWSENLDIWKFHPDVDVPHLIDYAAKRNVGIILWMAWAQVAGQEEKVAAHFAKLGAKGFKIDFMDRGDADVATFLETFAAACAKERMIVDYHGVYRPTGLQRAYPNVLNFEGVHGLEQMKFHRNDHDFIASDVHLAYTRMTAGPMDYTPGAMLNFAKGTYEGGTLFPGSYGTRCRQMAMMSLYEAPLQMLCDSPTNYEKNRESFRFMAATPTVWNATVGLGGDLDGYIALARQAKDGSWYATALTNWEARDYTLDTSFLAPGAWQAEIFRDAPDSDTAPTHYVHETKSVRSGEKLVLHLAPGGGFAIRFTPAKF